VAQLLAEAPEPPQPVVHGTSAMPAQGVYEYCHVNSALPECVSRLHRLGQAGFRAVLDSPMLDRGRAQILAYVDAAQAAGLQVIWPLHSLDFAGSPPDGTNLVGQAWGQACGCRTNQDLLAYVVSLARSRSNTWGYYIADEPGPEAHERVRSLVERVRALDPAHPRLAVGCGICGSEDPRSHISFLADLDRLQARRRRTPTSPRRPRPCVPPRRRPGAGT
jgi:hypothetical protein